VAHFGTETPLQCTDIRSLAGHSCLLALLVSQVPGYPHNVVRAELLGVGTVLGFRDLTGAVGIHGGSIGMYFCCSWGLLLMFLLFPQVSMCHAGCNGVQEVSILLLVGHQMGVHSGLPRGRASAAA
jgi:hypothetical protein